MTREIAHKFDRTTQKLSNVNGYKYHCVVYLTNISDKPVRVATEGLGIQCSPDETKQEVKLDLSAMHTLERSLVIPTEHSLGLVDLRTGESAGIPFSITTTVPLEGLSVLYSPTDPYSGRFGYWSGSIISPVATIKQK